jgi:hypothetical protein
MRYISRHGKAPANALLSNTLLFTTRLPLPHLRASKGVAESPQDGLGLRRRIPHTNPDFALVSQHREIARSQSKKGGLVGRPCLPAELQPSWYLIRSTRKVEQIKKIANSRIIQRHIRVAFRHDRVGKVVPAAVCNGLQAPVPLDEL